MNVLPLDDKRRHLLEAKLQDHAAVVANGIITSPPAHQQEQGEQEIPISSQNQNIVVIDSNSSGSGSRSNSRLSFKENNTFRTENTFNQKGRETPPKRPLEFESSDSFDAIRDDKVSKSKRVERLDVDSPEPEKLNLAAGVLRS